MTPVNNKDNIITDDVLLGYFITTLKEINPKTHFTVKTIMGDKWKEIKHSKLFGLKVKQYLLDNGYIACKISAYSANYYIKDTRNK